MKDKTPEPQDLFYNALISVYSKSAFWGTILSNIRKSPSSKIPTMGVFFHVKRQRFWLEYNEDFLKRMKERLTDEDYASFIPRILEHEVAHIIEGHVTDRAYCPILSEEDIKDPEKVRTFRRQQKFMNCCSDIVVNHLVDIKSKYVGRAGEVVFSPHRAEVYSLEDGRNLEWYMAHVPRPKGEDVDEGEDPSEIDDHSRWGKDRDSETLTPPEIQDLANQEIYRIVKEGVRQVQQGRGTFPAGFEDRIAAIMGWKVNWKRILRRQMAVAMDRSQEKEYTRKRPNRRFGWEQPGRRIMEGGTPPILAGFDCSGSVSDEEIGEYLGSVNNLLKEMDATIDIATFDVTVNKTHKRVKKVGAIDIKGRGGTDYNALVEKYNQDNSYKLLLVFTDGQCPPPAIAPRKPSYWFIWGKNRDRSFQVNFSKAKVFQIE